MCHRRGESRKKHCISITPQLRLHGDLTCKTYHTSNHRHVRSTQRCTLTCPFKETSRIKTLWKETPNVASVPSSQGARSFLQHKIPHIVLLILHIMYHTGFLTHWKVHKSVPPRIYGVVRFVDIRMLNLRPMSFLSASLLCPFVHPPNLFLIALRKPALPLRFLKRMLTVRLWEKFTIQGMVAEKKSISMF